MSYFEELAKKYTNREDKDNILPVGISDAEFREWCIKTIFWAKIGMLIPA